MSFHRRSTRYSLVDWGSRGGCRLGAAWAAGCGVSLVLLLSRGDGVVVGSILLPSIAEETKLPGQRLCGGALCPAVCQANATLTLVG